MQWSSSYNLTDYVKLNAMVHLMYPYCSRAANSEVSEGIWPKFKVIQALMVGLVGLITISQLVSEIFMFDSVDGRTPARVPYYKLPLSLWLWWAKNVSKKFFQEPYQCQRVWVHPGQTHCQSWPGSKLFAKVISTEQTTKVAANKESQSLLIRALNYLLVQ